MGWLAENFNIGHIRCHCPKCGGGLSEEVSFSIYLRASDGLLAGKCFRAVCGYWTLDNGQQAGVVDPPAFVPKPLRRAYRTKEFGLYGERVLVDDPTVTVWILRDLMGNRTGHITRTADKRVLTYKEVDRSVYYSNGLRAYGALWLFEDPRSAAMCAKPAAALLGTSLPPSLLDDIKSIGEPLPTVYVALDPGAEDAGAAVHRKLRDAGVAAVFVPMLKDFKDMTPEERDLLLETYS